MKGAGRPIEPRNLRGVPPEDKVRSRWATLRKREVTPASIVAAILGVAMCHFADYQPGRTEHRRVQIAKVLNRMAGGEVKRWRKTPETPYAPNLTLRWFPMSEGRPLRILGKEAEQAVEFLINDRMDELLRYAADRGAKPVLPPLPFPVAT
jgi:hypothetical protein